MEIEGFCESEYPSLVGALGLYCGDRWVAEELAQEALARAWRSWRRIRRYDNPSAWVQRVALNLANSQFRRRKAERRARERLDNHATVQLDADYAEALGVRQALAALPPKQRGAVVLRFYLDLPFAEVARCLGIPESTAKSLVRRGLDRMRLDPHLEMTEGALDAN